MKIKLLIANGKSAGRVIPVTIPRFLIGRATDCHLRLGSHLVSRQHCAILIKNGDAAVRDFGSTNGTQVNGDKIHGEQKLKDGDRLTVGALELAVRLTTGATSRRLPGLETAAAPAARTTRSSADRKHDVSPTQSHLRLATAPESFAETKGADAVGSESRVAGKVAAEDSERPVDQPNPDVSEEYKEEIRRRRQIPGACKATQAKRVADTPQDAIIAALARHRNR